MLLSAARDIANGWGAHARQKHALHVHNCGCPERGNMDFAGINRDVCLRWEGRYRPVPATWFSTKGIFVHGGASNEVGLGWHGMVRSCLCERTG